MLLFRSIQLDQQGEYRCTARNEYGDETQVLPVYVRPAQRPVHPTPVQPQPPHRISAEIEPSVVTGQPGEELRLTCRTQPGATIVWSKADRALPLNAHFDRETLIIQQARREDSGTYRCVVQVSGLRPVTAEADVYVEERDRPAAHEVPPQMQDLQPLYTVVQGDTLELPCVIIGAGVAGSSVHWSKVHGDFLSNVRQHDNTLRISGVLVDNRGAYQCRVTTPYGESQVSTVIEVERKCHFYLYSAKDLILTIDLCVVFLFDKISHKDRVI